MQFTMDVKIDLGNTSDEETHYLDGSFNMGAMSGEEHAYYAFFDDPFDPDTLVAYEVASMAGYAAGILDYLEFIATLVKDCPKMTFAQLEVVYLFEQAIDHGDLLMVWGITPDIARPPKGDGWEQYQAAKKELGL